MNWVKTSERVPETACWCVGSYRGGHVELMWASPGGGWLTKPGPDGLAIEFPNYWAEIPPLPKEKSLGERVWEAAIAIEPRTWECVRCAMNSASRAAFHAGPRYRSSDTHIAGMRIVIDDTLADGVVELLRA